MKNIILFSFFVLILTQCNSKVYRGSCKGYCKQMMMPKHKSPVRYH